MRILAIADIFEALTAERPYKKPMPVDRALSILNAMAKEGKLDASVIQEAVESGVFKRYAERELTACPPTAPR
jgi:HD-GYP domain-containing protein (c-di-GMP phosphodiesterase class II)